MKTPNFSFRLLVSLIILSPIDSAAQEDACHDFTVGQDGVTIPVFLKDLETFAVLTTSNIGSSISQGLVDELDLRVRTDRRRTVISSFGKERPYKYVSDVDVTFMGLTVEAKEMALVDSKEQYMGLSLRLFDGLITQLNFPESKICFYPREAINLKESQNINLSADPNYGTPVVRVSLNKNFETWLTVTPSFTGGLLVDPFTASSLELPINTVEEGDDDSNTLDAVIEELKFGPYELGNIAVQYPKPGTRDNLTTRRGPTIGSNISPGPGYRGRIGIGVLQHFVLTADFENELMHVYVP